MEEVQSWWEVPAVSHFCYAFRSAFNLFFFEIAELESALLNIQDPDMSISLDQLIVRLLQGCYNDDDSVDDLNWEGKLHEFLKENCEDDENLFNDTQYFIHLSPRSKIEILYRLCELRLDVEGALEAIKNIPPEDMQAKCLGKDSKNNTYWYFCDERLYKENPNALKLSQALKKKEAKSIESKNNKPANTREKRTTKAKPIIDKAWSIICHNISDWEKLMKTFSKSKSSLEKELVTAIKNHLPILQESVAEKDRLLRKRFMELAPKRSSSRISKVQEKKKIEEMKIQESIRKAQLLEEKERARLEAKRMKEEKESRQKRAEMRHKAIEERAKRVEFRERVRGTNESSEDDSDDDDDEDSNNDDYGDQNHNTGMTRQRRNMVNGKIQINARNGMKKIEESEEDYDDEEEKEEEEQEEKDNSDSDYEASSQRKSNRLKRTKHKDKKTVEPAHYDNTRRIKRTYSGMNKQGNDQLRVSSRLQNSSKTVKYKYESDESEQESDEAPSLRRQNGIRTRLQQNKMNKVDESNSEESGDENDSDDDDSRSDEIESKQSYSRVPILKTFTVTKGSLVADSSSESKAVRNPDIPKVTLYKSHLLNSSGTSNWTLDSKAQKLHILNSTFDNLSPKRIKLDDVKSTASSTLKSSLFKENHVYKPVQRTPTPFITYGRIIPTKPAIVRLDFRKPPNPPVSG